ncbi:hypothetical protein B7C51_24835 (plasmid) [Paenibacillus larvae subsp. pulvifaciens]|uniref:Phage protein n=1 Tax=Paenibacillus larvae subsp. pulvifaciens TaxID=1477 RepID=A0A1V0V006_9BACL|nr:hypothetical protein [Paenibacillus larvae]ARF70703.1 hypothetical protein B7C51_24835 [Paenibacillus larvae subsp. pulvifaciens]
MMEVDEINESILWILLEYKTIKMELKVKDAELKSTIELGLKYQEENKRLRGALEAIVSIQYDNLKYTGADASCMWMLANEALKEL